MARRASLALSCVPCRYRLAHWPLTELSTRPLSKAPDALAELCACRRVVDAPGPVGHFSPQRPVLRAAIPKHERRVQKAQDHSNGRKELLPGRLRRLPSLGADRLGRVVLIQEPSLSG